MPYSVPVPIGNNVAQVAGLSERTRSAEAKRSSLGINTTGGPVTTDGLNTATYWTFPGQNPTTVNVGVDGLLFVQGGIAYVGPLPFFFGVPFFAVGIDGTYDHTDAITLSTSQLSGGAAAQQIMLGLLPYTGLTPGWHEVTTAVFYSDGGLPYTFGAGGVWLTAWTL